MLFVVEGNEGTGKSTLVPRLVEALQSLQYSAVHLGEPIPKEGATMPHGMSAREYEEVKRIRSVALDESNDRYTRFMAYTALRGRHISLLSHYANNPSEHAVMDRYWPSTIAHQRDETRSVGNEVQGHLAVFPRADLWIWLHSNHDDLVLARNRRPDRERATFAVLQIRHHDMIKEMLRQDQKVGKIDAALDPHEVFKKAWKLIFNYLHPDYSEF